MDQAENETRTYLASKWCNIDFDRIRHSKSLFHYKLMASALISCGPSTKTSSDITALCIVCVCTCTVYACNIHVYKKEGSVQNGKIIMIYTIGRVIFIFMGFELRERAHN